MELYKKYRPGTLVNLEGQDEAKTILNKYEKNIKKIPHTLLLTGPSGVGKTTTGRILRKILGCSVADYQEINSANFKGIDTIREISNSMMLSPMSGPCKVYMIDEVHQMTSQAQDAFLKVLEDTPRHVYFILATTDSQKLKKTVITRCTEIRLKPISDESISNIIAKVCEKEGIEVHDSVVSKIIEQSEGSARKALVILDSISDIKDKNEQLKSVASLEVKPQAIELARALIYNKSWNDVTAILKTLKGEDVESIRYLILSYASSVLLNGGLQDKSSLVIQAFERNFYDSKFAGLVNACFEVSTFKR